jgi:hypothetical protein
VARKNQAGADRGTSRATIIAAALGAAGVIGAAAITALNQDGGEGPDGARETPREPAAAVELSSWGSRDVLPPPKVEFTFDGQATGLSDNDLVFVLGKFSDQAAGSTDPGDTDLTGPYQLSPPAKFGPPGSWRIRWPMDSRPSASSFTAVIVDGLTTDHAGILPAADAAKLRESGPLAQAVEASDTVFVSPGDIGGGTRHT